VGFFACNVTFHESHYYHLSFDLGIDDIIGTTTNNIE